MPDPRRRNPIARLNQHCRHGDDPSALARLALEGPPPCAFCVFGRSFPRPIRLLIDAIQFHLHSLAVDGLAHEPSRRAAITTSQHEATRSPRRQSPAGQTSANRRTGQDRGADMKGRTNQAFFSKVSYTAPGTPLAGYPLRTLAPVSRDESVVRAIQRPGVRP